MNIRNVALVITKSILFIICLIVFLLVLLITIFTAHNQKYETSFQYSLNLKYKNLINTDSPKIIIIGGSASAFSIDSDLISKATGMNVVNLGHHGGFNIKFLTNIAKANINENDIIVLSYEYALYNNMNSFTPDLVTSAIDGNIKLYKYIPKEFVADFISYIPTYVQKKLKTPPTKNQGVYSISSFDEKREYDF